MIPQEFPNYLLDNDPTVITASKYLQSQTKENIDALVVLGSGIAESLKQSFFGNPFSSFSLSSIPGVLTPVADGHLDEFQLYRIPKEKLVGSQRKLERSEKSLNLSPNSDISTTLSASSTYITVGVCLGRTHLYEGHGPDPVVLLAKAAAKAGVKVAILCNANGCIRPWRLGDVMTITDHLNFSGVSPFSGTVFLDVSKTWDPQIAESAKEVCERSGTYALLRGPEYQTQAESRWIINSGADCVGMSTVLEALTIHALGVRVCGLSVVSDISFSAAPTDASTVTETARRANLTITKTIKKVLATSLG